MSKKKMPIKKSMYDDEFESEELSEPETMVSKPKSRLKSAATRTKKGPVKKPVGMTRRAQSAPGTRSARELWLAAVKTRNTGSPRDVTMSGLKRANKTGWGFMSAPNYMRQLAVGDRGKKTTEEQALRQTAGTPAYKSQEEYYDDIIQLKKTIQASNQEISNLRSKLRRTEEDNLKKEKEIEQLLDPSKSEELRRTLTDRKADAGMVIHSLKQKVLKLEVQLRDKEASNAKMLADLKMTKVDEMKTQMEVLYREVVRLQHMKDVSSHDSARTVGKESGSKVKALNETVLRLNEQNQRLQQDNKKLRDDLTRVAEDNAPMNAAKNQNLQNLSKNELVSIVRRLNRRIDKAEQKAETDSLSLMSADVRPTDASSKIVLEGPVENRLDQLDRRETELLQETDKLRAMVKRLKDDRTFYRQASEEKSIEIKVLKNALEGLPPTSGRSSTTRDRKQVTPRKSSTRPSSARSETARNRRDSTSTDDERKRAIEKFQKQRAAKNIQKHWRQHQDKVKDGETIRKRDEKLQMLAENRAARNIQAGWLGYQHRQDTHATATIQAAMLGHRKRKARLHEWRDEMSTDGTDDEYGRAVDLISSSMTAHTARRKRLETKLESTTDEDDDILRKKPPRHSSSYEYSRPTSRRSITGDQHGRRNVIEEDDDAF